MRIALVHHWLLTWRGGERVLAEIARLYPDAPIYTLFGSAEHLPGGLADHTSHSSLLARGARFREALLPLYPVGVRTLDLRGFDLVISSDASVIKGVRVDPGAVHLCYCHAPPRYAWDFPKQYVDAQIPALLRPLAHAGLRWIRWYDSRAARRVNEFATNSRAVESRIQRHYGRAATVIPPPAELEFFTPAPEVPRENFYLFVGQLVPYKRADLAIEVCQQTGRKLVVVGEGPLLKELRRRAGDGVEVVGAQSAEDLRDLYRRCRALVFPGEEDFGIVPLEAMACGAPVVALGKGGALETVVGASSGSSAPAPTGIFFPEPSVASLARALDDLERGEPFREEDCVARAAGFSPEFFRRSFQSWVQSCVSSAKLTPDP
ncbi:MAG: glycosyltransferase [Candidatus Binatia bacterium]|nr:glycosyltransferase [Candidatus Binatia bacterium]MDG2010283.1 glycosyltransferase [Candidatus Binatia bacterium]HAC81248.1 glycosyl transferase [Deltaproteobacteria bacterium]